MENLNKANDYISDIFAMTRPKIELRQIFDKDGITKFFVRNVMGKDNITKTYYDTGDFFFKNRGINISTVESKTFGTNQLVVKLENNVKRIMFLSDMPTKNIKSIRPHDDVRKYVDFIEASVYDIFPNGVDADVRMLVAQLKPRMMVTKKRERFRIFNNNGLKIILSCDDVSYKNLTNRMTDRSKQFETQLDSIGHVKDYKDFVYKLSLQVPSLVPMDSSDIVNAYARTSFTKLK